MTSNARHKEDVFQKNLSKFEGKTDKRLHNMVYPLCSARLRIGMDTAQYGTLGLCIMRRGSARKKNGFNRLHIGCEQADDTPQTILHTVVFPLVLFPIPGFPIIGISSVVERFPPVRVNVNACIEIVF